MVEKRKVAPNPAPKSRKKPCKTQKQLNIYTKMQRKTRIYAYFLA